MKTSRICIQSTVDHPRFTFIVRQIFGEWLGLEVIHEKGASANIGEPLVEYGSTRRGTGILIPAHPYLDGGGFEDPDCKTVDGLPALFPVSVEGCDLPFDLLSMCFYLLSRHEEYNREELCDHLGRFPARASAAWKHGFLDVPLVDKWVNRLRLLLLERFPHLQIHQSEYQFIPSYDIDYFWAYQNRPFWHKAGGVFKSLLTGKWAHLRRRLRVISGIEADPFFTFDYLQSCHEKHGIHPQYFVLVGNFKGLDRSNAWHLPAVREAIRALAREGDVGLHPSVASNADLNQLAIEKRRIEQILKRPVTDTRQHFLCLKFPETYRSLCSAGFCADYSLGYSETAGFRASTSRSFLWYDIDREEDTGLRLHPFAFMDVALRRQSEGNSEEALRIVGGLVDEVKMTGGSLYFLWHNSSFYELEGWLGWQSVFEEVLLKAVRPKTQE